MVAGVQILAKSPSKAIEEILTTEALQFLAALHRTFESTRQDLLIAREVAQQRLDSGIPLDFPPETAHIRAEPSWICAPPAPGLEDRRVEITGPPDRKMVINALNSGTKTFMADFEGKTRSKMRTSRLGRSVIGGSSADFLLVIFFRLMRTDFFKSRQRSSQLARRNQTQNRL